MLGKNLQQIPALIEVDEDVVPLQRVEVLGHLGARACQSHPDVFVVRVRDRKKFDIALEKAVDRVDDIVCAQGDMLAARTVEVVAESTPLADLNRQVYKYIMKG